MGFRPPIVPLDPATREGDRLIGPFSALWYLVFVLPLFLFTPDGTMAQEAVPVTAGVRQLTQRGGGRFSHHRQIALFLLARMLYADGLGAVFAFGGIYAASVFGWGASELGLFGIILTLAGTVGAALRWSARRSSGLEAPDRRSLVPCSVWRRSACSRSTGTTSCSCFPSSPNL